MRMQKDARTVHVHPALLAYAVHVVGATRTSPELQLGASPARRWIAIRASRRRLRRQPRYVVPDDLKHAAEPVLAHRLLLRDEAWVKGRSPAKVLEMSRGVAGADAGFRRRPAQMMAAGSSLASPVVAGAGFGGRPARIRRR